MLPFIDNIKIHLGHYLVLFFILIFGFGTIAYFSRQPQVQILSAFITASFYVVWGVIHHYLAKDLHPRIILEYAAIALLGFLIIFSMVNRV